MGDKPTTKGTEQQEQFNAQSQLNNVQLSSFQKEQKKRLKSELKFQRKVQKLETRIAHAISRKDAVVEQQARKDLEELLSSQSNRDSQSLYAGRKPQCTENSYEDSKQKAAIEEVTVIFRQLLSSLDQHEIQWTKDISMKELQNSKARNLLQHMTKGTQTSDMFLDVTALRGYVRKKFHGRAALIIKSLSELTPEALQRAFSASTLDHVNTTEQIQYQAQREIMSLCCDNLSKIQRVCSIGCGPGNDVVGLIAFLRYQLSHDKIESKVNGNESADTLGSRLEEVLLLDYAMKEWNEAALNDLIPILVPQYVKRISCASCNVTKPLLSTSQDESNEDQNDSSIATFVQGADIFLTSYLLTETRNNWDAFYVQIVQLAPVGALFYFAEPMAWQLHRLIRMSSTTPTGDADSKGEFSIIECSALSRLKFIWIDSSMHYPELQQMDGRSGGPAVLLAIKL